MLEMKRLVVYYSFEGNTRFVAETIASTLDADILELKPKDVPPAKGFKKYLWGGRQVFTRQKPELEPLDKDPSQYASVFIGTPVWAFRHAPALETFFSQVPLSGKKIALFCCSGGMPGSTLDLMKARLAGNECVGQLSLKEPLRSDRTKAQEGIVEWAREMAQLC